MSSRHLRTAILCLLLPLPGVAAGQDVRIDDPEAVFWSDMRRQQAAAAAQVVIARDPFVIAALRLEGKRWNVWPEAEFADGKALPLDPDWLPFLRDDTFPPDLSKRESILKVTRSEWAYRRIFSDALLKAFVTPPDIFRRGAEDNPSVTWDQLMNNPDFYRGKIVGIKGKLRKLTAIKPPIELRSNFEHAYEAWIQTAGRGTALVFVFSVLPDGFKDYRNKVLEEPAPVECQGYFIMRYKYKHLKPAEDGQGKEEVEAVTPFLIGQTISHGTADRTSGGGWTVPMSVFLILAGVFGVVVLLMMGLRWWYQIEDKKIMERVNRVREARNTEMALDHFQDEPLPAAPTAERNGSTVEPSPSAGQPPGESPSGA